MTEKHKKVIYLPDPLYDALRKEAKQQGINLPTFVRRRIVLKPYSKQQPLANLPLQEIFAQTQPQTTEDRLDFFG